MVEMLKQSCGLPSPPPSARESSQGWGARFEPSPSRNVSEDKDEKTAQWSTPFTVNAGETIEEGKSWSSGASSETSAEYVKIPTRSFSSAGTTSRRKGSRTYAPMPLVTTLNTPTIKSLPQDTIGNISADSELPFTSPSVHSAHELFDRYEKPYLTGHPKALDGIALRSFCLGTSLSLSLVTLLLILLFTTSPLWRLPFFFAALSTFHFLEFWTTAKYHTKAATIDSFLLTANWPAYFIAHVSASLECLLTSLLFPHRSWAPWPTSHILVLLGILLVMTGQFVRALAMVQAGENFNHTIEHVKSADHLLVTTGIYGIMRHPSYFGFFWWGVGTQLVLGNPICFVGYAVVLWRFFSTRIRYEEACLCRERFFGEEYRAYRNRVPTRMPFIK